MFLLRVLPDMSGYDFGGMLDCEGTTGPQKNWVPLVLDETLYVVVHLVPLLVARVTESADGRSWECAIHQRTIDEEDTALLELQAVRAKMAV